MSRSQRIGRRSAGLALASLSLMVTGLASPVPAGASAERGEEVIVYEFDARSLPGFETVTVPGEHSVTGACEITVRGNQQTSDGFIEVGTEISHDPAGCTSTFAVAVYPVDDVPAVAVEHYLGGQDSFQEDIAPAIAEQEDGAVAAPGNEGGEFIPLYQDYARLWIAYRDPAFIPVTETETAMYWTGTNSCITAATSGHDSNKVEQTGWVRTAYDESFTFSCSVAYANTCARFANDPFCPGASNTTRTNHTGTHVYGYPGGVSDWDRTMSKSGGCNWLLHTTYSWTP